MAILPCYVDANGPGVALALMGDDGAPYVECRGLADVEEGIAITPDTPFDLASAGKMFTATAILRLIERDELALTSPVAELVVGFEAAEMGRPVTIRDLLAHTSGLHDYLELGMYAAPDEVTPQAIAAQLPAWSRAARAGVSHAYSNTNFVILARVIETVTGAAFGDALQEGLFRPLGLEHTKVHDPDHPSDPRAKGYHDTGYGRPAVVAADDYVLATVGDGGMSSTLNDLIRWQTLLWSGEVVGAASLRLMTTPGMLDSGEPFAYGLGMQIEHDAAGRTWCGHGGSWTRSTTLVGRYEEEACSVVVLSNEVMAPVERMSRRALALCNEDGAVRCDEYDTPRSGR